MIEQRAVVGMNRCHDEHWQFTLTKSIISRNDDQVEGGENVIVDAFPVVEEFRKTHPQHFTTLTQIPGTFQRIWKHGYD